MYVIKYKGKYINFGNRFKQYSLVDLPEQASLFSSLDALCRRRRDFSRMGIISADDLEIYDIKFSFTEEKVKHRDTKEYKPTLKNSEVEKWIEKIKVKVNDEG